MQMCENVREYFPRCTGIWVRWEKEGVSSNGGYWRAGEKEGEEGVISGC